MVLYVCTSDDYEDGDQICVRKGRGKEEAGNTKGGGKGKARGKQKKWKNRGRGKKDETKPKQRGKNAQERTGGKGLLSGATFRTKLKGYSYGIARRISKLTPCMFATLHKTTVEIIVHKHRYRSWSPIAIYTVFNALSRHNVSTLHLSGLQKF